MLAFQMTGRKGRVVSNDDGSISYESRSEVDVPVEILNITEKQRFMDGKKVYLPRVLFNRRHLPICSALERFALYPSTSTDSVIRLWNGLFLLVIVLIILHALVILYDAQVVLGI